MSRLFAAKSVPNDEKLRGGYYTPEPIARYIADWVGQAGSQLLEPSCGDGAIAVPLADYGNVTAVELFAEEATVAQSALDSDVLVDDFFQWFTEEHHGAFDGVAGNPPYIRFGSWKEEHRDRALEFIAGQGLKPTRLTNAWMPFVVASLVAVREGGRVGLVLPAELLQVGYAAQLRAWLTDHCTEVTVVAFNSLVFPGILQEVVVLLAVKGTGPASIRTLEVPDAEALRGLTVTGTAVRAPLHETEKWTKYFLESDEIEALRNLRVDPRLRTIGDFAAVNVGVVTGRNSFFCLTEREANDRQLGEFTIPLLARSAQIRGVTFTAEDLADQGARNARTRLLALPSDMRISEHPTLANYIAIGEAEGVHAGYKCSIRPSWWSVPSVQVPDGFMLRQVSSVLRLASNQARATSTDTVHRVFVKPGVEMDKLAVAALNSVTLAMTEIMGRSYGGGVLELEPRESVGLPIPEPTLVSREMVDKVGTLLRENRVEEATALVDSQVLEDSLGLSEADLRLVRSSWKRLQNRRLARGRK